MRDGNPANNENWALACTYCGTQWEMTETIDLMGGHFEQEHPEYETPSFNLIWVGRGPKPKKPPPQFRPRR